MDFLSFMKFAGSPEAETLGKKATSFTDEVTTLLTEIRDELRAIRKQGEGTDDGR